VAALPVAPGTAARILDAGSGSGRDARAFRQLGHVVEAFDASTSMVDATRHYAEVPTRLMLFEDFAWEHLFDGIWACASLLHIAREDLVAVIRRLRDHLAPGGVIYMSFKHGHTDRHENGRTFTDLTESQLSKITEEIGNLESLALWLSSDARPDRAATVWVNALVRRC
jgi:SAM-dependent methyltransferase